MQVRHRRRVGAPHVAPAVEGAGPAAREQDGQVLGRVPVAVAEAAAVEQRHVVEQRAVAVGRRLEPVQEVREQRRVVGVDAGQLVQLVGVVLVVRRGVVRLGHPDLGIGAAAVLAADHEADDAGQVRLVRQHLQVEHQPRVLVERGGNPERGRDVGQRLVHLGLGLLDAALDVAHRVEVLAELVAVAGAEVAAQVRHLVGHRVEEAAVLLDAREPGRGVGAAGVAEQPLEDRPRVGLHGQRRRRAAPADGVGVGAGVAAPARAHVVARLERELERRELGVPARLPRHELVHRDARAELRALGALGGDAGQEAGGARLVDVVGPLVAEPRHHEQAVAEPRQRLENRRDLEAGPLARGRPLLHDDAVRHVDDAEPPHRGGRGPAHRGQGGHHAVEQRQGQRRPHAAEHRTPGKGLLGDHHDSDLRIWNGVLSTMPTTRSDHR